MTYSGMDSRLVFRQHYVFVWNDDLIILAYFSDYFNGEDAKTNIFNLT